MKAVVFDRYGSPAQLHLQEWPRPRPGAGQVLVQIRAASINSWDYELLRGIPFANQMMAGVGRPKRIRILDAEVAGVVEAVGSKVTQFQPGDAVFGDLSHAGFGGFAEYVVAPKAALTPKPDNLSFAEAAAIPVGGPNALHFLRRAVVRPGERVLVYGSSGSIGTFAVQLARQFGAQVTAICSEATRDLVRSLGAHHCIDYRRIDVTQWVEEFDVLFDTIGRCPFPAGLGALKPGGRYLMANPTFCQQMRALWLDWMGDRGIIQSLAQERRADLEYLDRLIEAGRLGVVIDRRYPLERMVEAHRYVEQGHKRGSVVVEFAS